MFVQARTTVTGCVCSAKEPQSDLCVFVQIKRNSQTCVLNQETLKKKKKKKKKKLSGVSATYDLQLTFGTDDGLAPDRGHQFQVFLQLSHLRPQATRAAPEARGQRFQPLRQRVLFHPVPVPSAAHALRLGPPLLWELGGHGLGGGGGSVVVEVW